MTWETCTPTQTQKFVLTHLMCSVRLNSVPITNGRYFIFSSFFFFLTFKTSSYFFDSKCSYTITCESAIFVHYEVPTLCLQSYIVAKFPYGLRSLSQGTYTQINRKCWKVCLLFWYRLVFPVITCVCVCAAMCASLMLNFYQFDDTRLHANDIFMTKFKCVMKWKFITENSRRTYALKKREMKQ